MIDALGIGSNAVCRKRLEEEWVRGADLPLILFGVILFWFLLGFFLFQAVLVLSDECTELWIVVLLAVQRIV